MGCLHYNTILPLRASRANTNLCIKIMTIATRANKHIALLLFLLSIHRHSQKNVRGFSIIGNTNRARRHAPSSAPSAAMNTLYPVPVLPLHRPSFRLSSSTNSENEEESEKHQPSSKSQQEEEVTPEKIAEMIEVSFLQSCLQLSQGYIDVLKLFIVAVQAGYERRLPLRELIRLVDVCPVNSAGRELMPEEKSLRGEWMSVVYSTLYRLETTANDGDFIMGDDENHGDEGNEWMTVEEMNTTSKERVQKIVRSVQRIRNGLRFREIQTGGKHDAIAALSAITVEKAMEMDEELRVMNEEYASSPMDRAFFVNDVRVALLTCRVVEEEKLCSEGSRGNKKSGGDGNEDVVPRPSIPGTS
ncbi:hypothetical protein ACHAXS_003523 [Conticribra weissflogii]